jgi:hypothetical protein
MATIISVLIVGALDRSVAMAFHESLSVAAGLELLVERARETIHLFLRTSPISVDPRIPSTSYCVVLSTGILSLVLAFREAAGPLAASPRTRGHFIFRRIFTTNSRWGRGLTFH